MFLIVWFAIGTVLQYLVLYIILSNCNFLTLCLDNGGISSGAIAGIVTGGIVAVVLVILIITAFCFVFHKKKGKYYVVYKICVHTD